MMQQVNLIPIKRTGKRFKCWFSNYKTEPKIGTRDATKVSFIFMPILILMSIKELMIYSLLIYEFNK